MFYMLICIYKTLHNCKTIKNQRMPVVFVNIVPVAHIKSRLTSGESHTSKKWAGIPEAQYNCEARGETV